MSVPSNLLVHPCKAAPPGDTVIELGRAYNANTSCIAKYKAQLEKIKDNQKKKEMLYVNPKQ